MSGVSDKKLKNRTLQLRAGSEYIELIEIIVNSANMKAAMAGSTQIFNNSDVLKEAIKGLTGQDTYIDIEGNRFDIKDLADETLIKFDGELQDIIDKEQLENLLKIGAVRFINDFGSQLQDAVDDIQLDEKNVKTINIDGVETDLSEVNNNIRKIRKYNIENYINYNFDEDESFKDVIEKVYGKHTNKSMILDDKEVNLEALKEIKEDELRDDIRIILKFNNMNNVNWNIKTELKEYIKECVLDSEEFKGINAYKLKNDYNQKRIMTSLNAVIDYYIKDIC